MVEEAELGPSAEALMLQRYAQGDHSALDELVSLYQTPAYWVARHLVHDDDLARDLVQDAFIRVLRKPELYNPERPFKAWFLQIVRNLSIDYLRKKRPVSVQVIAESAVASDDATTIGPIAQRELGERIQYILSLVPEKYRELLILRDVEGHAAEDIATITETDYGTTRWRIHQARKLFRKAWIEHYGDDLP